MSDSKINTKIFIDRSIKIHNNKYDYSKSIYKNCSEKVIIICKEHGCFEQSPEKHMKGQGCKLCGINKRSSNNFDTTHTFIEKAKEVHGDKYDYSKVFYKNTYEPVIILCKIHGVFNKEPNKHLQGVGCRECSGAKEKLTTKMFISRSVHVHGSKFDYSLVKYVNIDTHVKILCATHGVFEQTPYKHLMGNGCPKCCKTAKMCTNDFIQKANKIHGNKYKYNKSIYVNTETKLIIECIKHGEFYQTPNSHLCGSGCPRCIKTISNKEEIWLNSIGIPRDFRQYPLKINNRIVKVDGFCQDSNTVYEFYGDYWHGNPKRFKHNEMNKTVKRTFGSLYNETINRELELTNAGFKVISIWESDFNKSLLKC